MAYFAPYIDDSGLHIPSYNDIRDYEIGEFKRIYGNDIYLENDSQDYEMISSFSLLAYDVMQTLQIIYNNRSPKTAVGSALDGIVKMNGIKRKSASYSTCVLTLTGDIGTVITNGVAQDRSSNNWKLPASVTILYSPFEVTAICEKIGAIEAVPNTITKIMTPTKGWISVTNMVAAVVGAPVETDEELKYRQSVSVAIPSVNMVNSLIAGLYAVDGVKRLKVYDNDTNLTDENGIPGHSVACVVEGGLDDDISEQIYLRKGPGTGTYGDVIGRFVNADDLPQLIRFFRPEYALVDVEITLKKNNTYTAETKSAVFLQITEYLKSLDIGSDVTMPGLEASIYKVITNTSKPQFTIQELVIGKQGETLTASDIDILFNEVSDVGEITITEV